MESTDSTIPRTFQFIFLSSFWLIVEFVVRCNTNNNNIDNKQQTKRSSELPTVDQDQACRQSDTGTRPPFLAIVRASVFLFCWLIVAFVVVFESLTNNANNINININKKKIRSTDRRCRRPTYMSLQKTLDPLPPSLLSPTPLSCFFSWLIVALIVVFE
jgi:hypothetical protein